MRECKGRTIEKNAGVDVNNVTHITVATSRIPVVWQNDGEIENLLSSKTSKSNIGAKQLTTKMCDVVANWQKLFSRSYSK